MKCDTKILNGKWLSKQVLALVTREVEQLVARGARPPGLGVILVGENPASQAYVASKEKSARSCGFRTFDRKLSSQASLEQVQGAIAEFNELPEIDGILLQLPLPSHLASHTNALISMISPAKDADGLHPFNQGLLLRGEGALRPCTPVGVMKLVDLAYAQPFPAEDSELTSDLPAVDLSGKSVVVIGRSILVGKPLGFLFLERNATVTMAHSKSHDLAAICRSADIVVAAVGKAHLVKKDWVKPGAIVIDVGMNRLDTGKLTGDVDFEGVATVSAAITPVPGGVGPMTVSMLIRNTLESCKLKLGKKI